MKAAFSIILVAAIAIGFWQREKLVNLHALEQRASVALNAESSSQGVVSESIEPLQTATPVSEIELTDLSARMLKLRTELANERTRDSQSRNWPAAEDDAEVCSLLSRLTSQQLRRIIEDWERDESNSQKHTKAGISRLMNLAGMMNPRATLDAMFEIAELRGEKGAVGDPSLTLSVWFDRDPAELLRWARGRQAPESVGLYKETFATWVAAAEALAEMTPETVGRLLSHSNPLLDWQKNFSPHDVFRKLETYESRLTYLRCLHAATGGTTPGWLVDGCAQTMSWLIPFGQAAMMADSLPGFRPANKTAEHEGRTVYFGSLRFAIAEVYRDGTVAARWNWLVSRPEDRPQEKQLEYLIGKWCESEYGNGYDEVATWARSLPPGAERSEIRQAILAFCKEQLKRPDVIAEWEAP